MTPGFRIVQPRRLPPLGTAPARLARNPLPVAMHLGPRTVLVLVCLGLPAAAGVRPLPVPTVCPADAQTAIDDACPCDGRLLGDGSLVPWKSHGQYVSCASRVRNALRRGGCLGSEQRQEMARCAARSTCGRLSVVVCCLADTGMCTDAEPGDGVAGGFCSNDPARDCDLDDDCTTVHAKLMRNEDACYEMGGAAVDGSVCSACGDLLR